MDGNGFGVRSVREVPIPVADLLAVFLKAELNPRWNTALSRQQLKPQATGPPLALQLYPLPWPLANREFLVQCEERTVQSTRTFLQSCRSVEDADFPVSEGAVRGLLRRSSWEFQTLPGGRTRISFESFVDPQGDLPKWIVSAAQQLGSHQLTNALLALQARLSLPPHPAFVHWATPTENGRLPPPGAPWAPVLRAAVSAASRLNPAAALGASWRSLRAALPSPTPPPRLLRPSPPLPLESSPRSLLWTGCGLGLLLLLLGGKLVRLQRGACKPERRVWRLHLIDVYVCLAAAFAVSFVWYDLALIRPVRPRVLSADLRRASPPLPGGVHAGSRAASLTCGRSSTARSAPRSSPRPRSASPPRRRPLRSSRRRATRAPSRSAWP